MTAVLLVDRTTVALCRRVAQVPCELTLTRLHLDVFRIEVCSPIFPPEIGAAILQ
ncbi:MAG: hypothetical protein ACK550_12030 [Synechococcaceae cyanobacterium]